MDKLEELKNVIKQWNANRLDLFEISEPNEELEFHGVMRFYFQDAGQKVATKCIRVSSTASTNDVIETLIEKFRPDIRMLTLNAEYALYEIHESGEERKLECTEKPLVVQLNWNQDDREGRFLLRRMNEKTMLPGFNDGSKGKSKLNGKSSDDNTFKRKLSKREKKEKKKKEKEGQSKEDDENKEKLAEMLYNELPETSFTRSISNPEAVMRKRRQLKLQKKLEQLVNEGGSEAGGTLRIFGETLNKNVPYKTLLLSCKENSQYVVKEILEKYGLGKEDPTNYCLVQLIVPPNLANLDKDLDLTTIQNLSENIKEYILDDEDCPLIIERTHNKNLGILTFHIRKKPENYTPKKRSKNYADEEEESPFFVEVNPQDGKPMRKHILTHCVTEVGCSNAPNANTRGKQQQTDRQHLHLVGGNVQPKHCVITYMDGIVTVTPDQDPEAETFVNNLKITDSYILKHGMVVRFGKHHTFNFVDPSFEKNKNQLSPDLLNQMQNSKLNSINNSSSNNGGVYANNEQDDQMSSYSRKSEPQLDINQSTSQQQLKKCEAILPAVLELWEETEEPFLNSIITNVDVNQVQFKLAPTYTLYLAVRYRASTRFRPNATVEERAVRLTELTNKFCQMIKYVIHINHSDPSRLAFWLANSSELLHFLKQDCHLSAFTVDGQESLAESVQIAFKKLVICLEIDLDNSMINLLSENEQEASTAINKMLTVLNGAMALLRNCRVNAALTIQMFSQIFHYINMYLFNQLVGVNRNENASININYCTENWGIIIKQRLMQIINWAKKQGLELAADCYLNTILQAAILLQSIKSTSLDNLDQLIKAQCYKLNSLQLRYILQQFERSGHQHNSQYIPQHLIEQLVDVAEQTSDKMALDYGREIRLAEESDLHLAFLLPEDGYFCDTVKGVPQGLQEFILPMVVHKLCNIAIQPTSAGHWTIFLNNPNLNNNSNNNNTSINSVSNSSSNNNNHETSKSVMSPINNINNINKPSVLPGLNLNHPQIAYSQQDISSTEPTTPTVNMMNHPANWSINNSQHQQQLPPHFLISAGNAPQRTMSTQQLGNVVGPANFLAAQQQIYGQQQPPFNSSQLNLIQQQQQFIPQPPKQPLEITTIKLKKGNSGMGLSIVAARASSQEPFGIYIKSVVPDGAAHIDGRLKAGDQLLKVDNNSLIGISQEKAAELMTQTGSIVTLEVAKAAAYYNNLVSLLQNNNSPRMPALQQQQLNKAATFNNRMLPGLHSANPLMPKSQTTEHLKQHSSLVNLHPYSTYPYPHQQQQNIHQQQLAMLQQAALLQQQAVANNISRPNSQMIIQPSTISAQQFQAAQKRLSTSTMNEDPRNSANVFNQPTYQNISLYQQQRMNASSQNALYNPSTEQQLIQQQFAQLNRPMSTIMNREDQMQHLNYSMSQTNLSSTSNTLRSQPQHYSSVSQLSTGLITPSASSMPTWATGGSNNANTYQQTQQLINQRNQQQLYMQRKQQEEKLNKLKLEQEQQLMDEQDDLLELKMESQSTSSIKKSSNNNNNNNNNSDNNNWQNMLQKTHEEQEERLQKLKLEESKLKEELQVAEEVEERLIREARKRKEDPLKHQHYSQQQQQQQQQSSEDTDNSDEGITVQQQQQLERLLSRNYQSNVSSNGIVTLPPSSSHNTTTNTLSTNNINNQLTTSSHQRNLPSSNVQSISQLQQQPTSQQQSSSSTMIVHQSKSALRNPNKDSEQNGDLNGSGTSKVNINKKVSWNEQIVNNAIIIHNEDDDLDDEVHSDVDNYDEDYANGAATTAAIDVMNVNENGDVLPQSTKDKIESSFTLQDIDEVLGSPNEVDDDFSNNPNQPNNTPNVIGAQEVYRDPRERIKAEKMKQNNPATFVSEVPETLSFKEKMKMFATRVE